MAWTVAAIALVVALVAAALVAVRVFGGSSTSTPTAECTIPTPGTVRAAASAAAAPGPVYLTAVQLQHASTINAVGMSRGLPERARIIAIATAFQESGLKNLPSGDRDSVGLFQQRPSQGWGTRARILDPVYAADRFYDALLKVTGWRQLPLTRAAQAVQLSGFPDAYAKWEGRATILADVLGGAGPLSLNCAAGAQAPTAAAPDRKALAGTSPGPLGTVLSAAEAEMGGLRVVAASGSTATVTISVPGVGSDQAGRALAAWAVAHGTGFGVTAVSVDDQRWTDHAWGQSGIRMPSGRVAITTG